MPHASQNLPELRQRAQTRGGVVTPEDLRACGVSDRAAARRVLSGDWSRVGRALVLSPDTTFLGDDAWTWILRLTYGERARISEHLAMRRAGWSLPHETRIIVLAHQPKSSIPGVVTLRRMGGSSVRRPDGVQFMHAREALVDALTVLRSSRAADLLDATLQRRLVSADEFAACVAPRLGHGRKAAGHLRSLVGRALSGSRSEAEQRMGVLLKRSRTGVWVPNLSVRDDSGRIVAAADVGGEIDFANKDLRIAIEVDGRAHHSDRRSFEGDRARQNSLVLMGWLVLRFTWEQITRQPDVVIAAVRSAVPPTSAAAARRGSLGQAWGPVGAA